VVSPSCAYLFIASGIDVSAFISSCTSGDDPRPGGHSLFTLRGYLLSASGAPRRLIRFADALLGRIPGGLSSWRWSPCAVFHALTGATGLTIIALGGIFCPPGCAESTRKCFRSAADHGGTLGLLFPPMACRYRLRGVWPGRDRPAFVSRACCRGVLLVALFRPTASGGRQRARSQNRLLARDLAAALA